MIYADLPAGGSVLLDASVFIHHFEPNALNGPSATEFLERIENQEIIGVTTTHVLSEVAHRLMTIEAMQAFGWPSPASPCGSGTIRPKCKHCRDSVEPFRKSSCSA